MGRSDLQGTPWHYEYAKGIGKNNSKNCAFNVGYCSCTASLFHGKECVGKLECEDFERGNTHRPQTSKQKSVNNKQVKQKRRKKESKNQKHKSTRSQDQQKAIHLKRVDKPLPKDSIKVGDSITVQDLKTREIFDFTISDSKNKFVGKVLSQSVEINQVYYKVVRINDRQVDRKLE